MRRETWAQRLDRGKIKDQGIAPRLRAANRDDPRDVRIEALLAAFFTKTMTTPGRGRAARRRERQSDDQGLAKEVPRLEDDLRREQDRLDRLCATPARGEALERSVALFGVAKAILSTYARLKGARGPLDFDDLIARALALLTRVDAAWVLYKLDYGLDHMLVDEAQDTAPPQWRSSRSSARNSSPAPGARGGEPHRLRRRRREAVDLLLPGRRAGDVRRDAPPVRERHRDAEAPVRLVAAELFVPLGADRARGGRHGLPAEAAWRGVAAPGSRRRRIEAFRREPAGRRRESGRRSRRPKAPEREDWRMPLDEPARDDPPVLAGRPHRRVIALAGAERRASAWSTARQATPRRIRAGDVMILVRSRGAFFEAMIRALKATDIKTAGADRLTLRDHIAVMDLVAAGRAALLPDDDLTLAGVSSRR